MRKCELENDKIATLIEVNVLIQGLLGQFRSEHSWQKGCRVVTTLVQREMNTYLLEGWSLMEEMVQFVGI